MIAPKQALDVVKQNLNCFVMCNARFLFSLAETHAQAKFFIRFNWTFNFTMEYRGVIMCLEGRKPLGTW